MNIHSEAIKAWGIFMMGIGVLLAAIAYSYSVFFVYDPLVEKYQASIGKIEGFIKNMSQEK